MRQSTDERFWAKVDRTETCWIWTASKQPTGYGQFRADGKVVLAHRYAYQTLVGTVPDGLHLDHLCRVRACVNPAHLEPVTPRVNTNRGDTSDKVNQFKTHCPRGHEYTSDNTYIYRGSRTCIACHRAHVRDWKRRKRLGLAAPVRTHCRRGHELNADNTRFTADGRRFCRVCVRLNRQDKHFVQQ